MAWSDIDERCPNCNNVTKPAKGLNKQNLKRLVSFKITLNDLITLGLILLVVLSAWAYNRDIAVCRDAMKNIPDYRTLCSNVSAKTSQVVNITLLNNTLTKWVKAPLT
jgi:hypothetical protein